jgi:hypothetical protein
VRSTLGLGVEGERGKQHLRLVNCEPVPVQLRLPKPVNPPAPQTPAPGKDT